MALFFFRVTTAVCFLLACGWVMPVSAQATDGSGLWQDVSGKQTSPMPADLQNMPSRHRTLELDEAVLEEVLAELSSRGNSTGTAMAEIMLPLPAGGYGRFLVSESSVMAPELSAKYPDIKSYAGRGLDDPTATVRFDYAEHGFNALILSVSGSYFIAPRNLGDRVTHLSFDFRDVPPVQWIEPEIVMPEIPDDGEKPVVLPETKAVTTTSGSQLRLFRMAVTASGDYTVQNGGTVASALAAINTKINQLSAIWEREAAVRFVLVADNDLLIFTDPGTDPFDDLCGSNELDLAQSTVDGILGSANYDIHHLFLKNYCGGVVGGSMCVDGQKGKGQTGVGIPIDILAHEVGHQHTMSHTWSLCNSGTGGQYQAASAYEPGSGDTILSYAGICGVDNVASGRTLQYHVRSLDQKTSHLAARPTCGTSFTIANTAPVPSGGSTLFTFPRSTPFVLNGSAADAEGDILTYSWEQFDLPDVEPPSDPGSAPNNGEPPFFRRFAEVSTPLRTFPQISDVINNTASLGEELPDHARTLTMRLITKDNAAGGGGVAYDEISIDIDGTAGPFAVTSPNTGAEVWLHGASENVTWNVASTDLVPIQCSLVDIDLSTDGGSTFPTSLAAATANDGTESITVPTVTNVGARVRVRCVDQRNTADTADVTDHYFFDMSDADFSVLETAPAVCVTSLEVGNFADSGACSLRDTVAAAPAGSTITFHANLNGGTIVLTTGEILIDKSLAIDGDDVDISVSAGGAARIFRGEGAGTLNITFEGFTLREGNAGGGQGGAFHNCGETVVFRRMTIESNSGSSFGALGQNCGNGYTIWDSTLVDNSTGNLGAAIYLVNGTTTVHRSTFIGNYSSGGGGAVFIQGGTLIVNNSTVTGNSSGGGAGAGLRNGGGTLILNNVTVAGNTTSSSAGGNVFNSNNMTLRNTIIADALGGSPDCGNAGTIDENTNTLIEDGTCNAGTLLTGFTSGDPSLSALADNGGRTQTMALQPGSTAIDAGDNTICEAGDVSDLDQRSYLRSDATCDRGAYEAGGTPPTSNRPPVIFDSSFAVLGAATNGTTVGTVPATDIDGDGLRYTITGQTSVPGGAPSGVFAIVPSSGRLTVADATQLPTHTSFSLTVSVTDDIQPGISNSGSVDVTVVSCVPGAGVVRVLADSGNCSLRGEIAAATPGDTITFDAFLTDGTITLASEIVIAKNLTIDGAGREMTVSGGGATRVFNVTTGTVSFLQLKMKDGNTGGNGGAILIASGANVTVQESTIINNTAATGGGIDNSGTLTVRDSTLSGNNNTGVLGIAIHVRGTTNVVNSTISGNTGANAAIMTDTVVSATLNLTNVTFANNPTALFSFLGTVNMTNTIMGDSLGVANDCTNAAAVFNDLGGNLIEKDGSCLGPISSGDLSLGPLASNGGLTQTHALLGGSLAISNGVGATCVAIGGLDQRKAPHDALCDSGAFEFGATAPAVTPVITAGQLFAVQEGAPLGASLGTVQLDRGASIGYTIISGNTGNALALNLGTGELTVATPGALNAGTTPLYELLVQAQETASPNPFDQKIVAIRVWEQTPPAITASQVFAVNELASIGTAVGTVQLDQPASVTFSLIDGNTDNAFTINSASGQITVRRPSPLDPSVNTQFQLLVSVIDASSPPMGDIGLVTVNVSNLNRAPTADDNSILVSSTVTEGTFVGAVAASDPDPGDFMSFSITAGNTGGAFSIDPTSGNLFVVDNTGFGALPSFALTVQVTDNGSPTLNDTATVNMTVSACFTPGVVTSTADSGPCTLRQAVLDASSGDTITFDPILSNQTINLTTGEILIDKSLTIDGDGVNVSVSAGDTARIFRGESGPSTVNITFESFTLRDGNAGGGQGGAFYNCGETVVFRRMTIESNSGSSFGALGQNCGNGYTIWDSTFKDNTTGNRGSVIYLVNGTTTVNRSTFTGNSSSSGGGAVYIQGGTLIVNNSTVNGNSSAGSAGSGLRNDGGTLILNNVTVAGNTTTSGAGGNVYNANNMTLRNTIIADALGGSPDCGNAGTIDENTNTLVEDGTCNSGSILSGFVSGDPALGVLANNGGESQTMAISGGPAKNTGDNATCEADDQRAYTRSDGLCDRGAYEDAGTAPVLGTARTWDGGGSTNDWSEAANWTGDTVPALIDSANFGGSSVKNAVVDGGFAGTVASLEIGAGYSGTVSLARSLAVTGDLSVAAGATLGIDGQTLSCDGTVSSFGTIRDTRSASVVSTTVSIARIRNAGATTDKYLGAEITPTASSLGNVTVEIVGGASCGSPSDPAVQRCFEVTPDNQVAADLRLYYGQGELGSQHASELVVYRYNKSGGAWETGGASTTQSESDFACFKPSGYCWAEAAGVSAYSPFALSSTSTPSLPCSAGVNLTADQWRQIALPCDPGPTGTVQTLFAGADDGLQAGQHNVRWAMHDWNEATETYDLLSLSTPIVQGQSYWIKSLDPAAVVVQGGNETGTFQIPLIVDIGGRFNMVGHTFNNLEEWAGVLVNDGISDLTLDEADPLRAGIRACDHLPTVHADCVMSRKFYHWNGSAYSTFDGETPGAEGELEALKGFWVRAYRTATLKIPPSSSAATDPSPPPRVTTPESWFVRLSVSAGELKDRGNVLGRAVDASDGFDSHDLLELDPYNSTYLTVVFPHDDWGPWSANYTTDYRSALAGSEPEVWRFVVDTSAIGEEVTMRWQGPAEVLARSSLMPVGDATVTIEPDGSYSFISSGEDVFAWVVEPPPQEPNTNIFSDDFESGNAGAWSGGSQ